MSALARATDSVRTSGVAASLSASCVDAAKSGAAAGAGTDFSVTRDTVAGLERSRFGFTFMWLVSATFVLNGNNIGKRMANLTVHADELIRSDARSVYRRGRVTGKEIGWRGRIY